MNEMLAVISGQFGLFDRKKTTISLLTSRLMIL